MQILVGLPAYNEGIGISRLLDRINDIKESSSLSINVIVVNDGSTDDTEEYLMNYSSRLSYINYLNHHRNEGLAQAIRTIMGYALNNLSNEDILIILDADNTHNPGIIPNMVDKLIINDLDIVIASRFEPGGKEIGLSLDRKIFSKGASIFANIFFGIKNVRDYSCGFRAYRIGFLRKAYDYYGKGFIEAKGFECMIEIIIKAGFLGANIEEYPLILEYNLKTSPSKMKILKTINGYLRLGIKYNRLKGGHEQWDKLG